MKASSFLKQMTSVSNASKVNNTALINLTAKLWLAVAVLFLSACASTPPADDPKPVQAPTKVDTQAKATSPAPDAKKNASISAGQTQSKAEAKSPPLVAKVKSTETTNKQAAVKSKSTASKKNKSTKNETIAHKTVATKKYQPTATVKPKKHTTTKKPVVKTNTVKTSPTKKPSTIKASPKVTTTRTKPTLPKQQIDKSKLETKQIDSTLTKVTTKHQSISIPAITLDLLPLQIGDWTIDRSKKKPEQCSITSTTTKLEDGAGGTPVTIIVDRPAVIIKTKSDIDLSYTSSQLKLDDTSFKYDSVIAVTSAQIKTNYVAVIDALKSANIAIVELGFWPSWPQTQTYQATIPNRGFASAYGALEQCDKVL
ncbi:MAG: hypothetical protein MI867_29390 [Pseudomonadales bacterium]|nr:hypothetical protein [Pseudomonadales bacterium]